jgi:hypothetical protein
MYTKLQVSYKFKITLFVKNISEKIQIEEYKNHNPLKIHYTSFKSFWGLQLKTHSNPLKSSLTS